MRFVSNYGWSNPRRMLTGWLALLAICLTSLPALAQQNERPTSLDIVPQSVAYYWASMNHAAQYEAIVESNACKQLMSCDVAKRMRKAYRSGRRNGFDQFGYSNPFADYLEGYAASVGSIPGKMMMNYLSEIFGNEVFVYADRGWIDMSRAMTEYYKSAAETMEDVDLNNMDEEVIRKLLQIGKQHLEDVNTPHFVIGTVLDSPGGTKSLLQIFEAGIDQLLTQVPDQLDYVIEGYDVIEEDDMYLLTFQLDAESMPWEEVEDDPEIGPYIDDIRAIVANKTINFSFGVKGKYFLLAVGPNANHVRNFGKGDLLIDLPELAPLKKAAAAHAITSVSYMSDEMATYNRESMPDMIDSFLSFAKLGLQNAPPEVQEDLEGLAEDLQVDAEELKKDLMSGLARPGSYLGFSYLFDQGFEGFVYNRGENQNLDSSKPLTIIDHLGSQPTLFAAARDKGSRAQFGMARKWFSRIYDRVTKYAPRTAPSQKDALMFVEISSELRDTLSKIAEATDVQLLAATENGQSAFVLDFSTKKKSWHPQMPPSEVDLPIPAFATLIEHRDRDQIVAAGTAYHEAIANFLESLKEYREIDLPRDFVLPKPEHRSEFGGDLYYFSLPEEAGVDSSIAPHALVRDNLLVLGYSLDQTERLLSDSKPQLKGLLADRSRNAMTVSYYNNRELVDALYAWFQYGIGVAKAEGAVLEMDQEVENDLLAFQEAELMDALDHVVALLRCFESLSSVSYMENDVQVTHYQMLFQDVPEK